MEFTYPLPAFHFTVAIAGQGRGAQDQSSLDTRFSEVSGLEASLELEDVREGGLARYVHRLPIGTKHGPLVLKRGLIKCQSYLANWAAQTIGTDFYGPIKTHTLVIMLLGSDNQPRFSWNVSRAWPVRWDWGSLNSTRNEVMIESIEFAHSGIQRHSKPASLATKN